VQAEAPVEAKKISKLDGHRKLFENAWWSSGAEIRGDLPYVSRSALKSKLSVDGFAERTIVNMLTPSRQDMVGMLLQGEVIQVHEHGWILVDQVHSSAMLMRKNMS
jgi:hypothetical protein